MTKGYLFRKKRSVINGFVRFMAMLLVFVLFMGGSGMNVLAEEVGEQVDKWIEEAIEESDESIPEEGILPEDISEESGDESVYEEINVEESSESENITYTEEPKEENLSEEETPIVIEDTTSLLKYAPRPYASGDWGETVHWELDDEGFMRITQDEGVEYEYFDEYANLYTGEEEFVKSIYVDATCLKRVEEGVRIAFDFSHFPSLTDIEFGEHFNTEYVTDMRGLFVGCELLRNIDLSLFDVSNVTDMSYMFASCRRLASINMGDLKVENIQNLEGMFYECNSLNYLDMSNIDMSSVKNTTDLFYGCCNLRSMNTPQNVNVEIPLDGGWIYADTEENLNTLPINANTSYAIRRIDSEYGGVEGITLNPSELSLEPGQYYQLSATIEPQEASVKTIIWTSSDERIATVNQEGKISAHKNGTVIITARAVGGLDTTATCLLTVNNLIDSGKWGEHTYWGITNRNELLITQDDEVEYEILEEGDLPWLSYRDTIEKIIIDATCLYDRDGKLSLAVKTYREQDMSMMYKNVYAIVFEEKFDSSRITDMSRMFYLFSGKADLRGFDTSNVVDMSEMFAYCIGDIFDTDFDLDNCEWNLSNLDTSKVTDMSGMFYECYSLKSLDISNFNTSNVTDMSGMFYNCSSLTGLNVSSFDTSNVTDMSEMFLGCDVESLDLSSFDTSNVTDMSEMFLSCDVESLDLSSFDTSNVTDMRMMFAWCEDLESLDVSNFDTSNVTDMSEMFRECYSLTSLNLNSFNINKVSDMRMIFAWCEDLESLDISSFNKSEVNDMSEMFFACRSLTSLNICNLDTSKVANMSNMFYGCSSLTSLNVSSFNTSAVTDMSDMFYGCSGLTSLNVSNFNTSAVTDMGYMFSGCSGLTSLNVSSFNTSAITDMSGMFYNCSSLTGLNVSNFNTRAVTDMSHMFSGCKMLMSINVRGFYTENVEDMSGMFQDCTGLSSIDVSNFDTSNLVEVRYMFNNCSGLTRLDLSTLDFKNVDGYNPAFASGTKLVLIKTPINLASDVQFDEVWLHSITGKEMVTLPKDSAKSITIYRKANTPPGYKPFDYYKYQADFYMLNRDAHDNMVKYLNEETYCESVVNEIDGFEAFFLELWSNKLGYGYVKDPASLTTYRVDKEDLYFSLVMAIIKQTSEDNAIKLFSEAVDDTIRGEEMAEGAFKGIASTTVIANIPNATKLEYGEFVKEWCKNNTGFEWEAGDKLFGIIDDLLMSVETIGDFWNALSNLMYMRKLDENIKNTIVVWRDVVLKTEGRNSYLYGALNRAVNYFKEPLWIEFSSIANRYAYQIVYKVLWDKVLDFIEKKCPAALIVMGIFEAGFAGANYLANTDAIVEAKINCVMMSHISTSLDSFCIRMIDQYNSNPTRANAQYLLESVNMMYSAHMLDRDCAIQLAHELDGGDYNDPTGLLQKINKFLFPNNSHEEAIRIMQNEKRNISIVSNIYRTLWIGDLKTTHPESGLYEKYDDRLVMLKDSITKMYTFACPVDVRVVCGDKESYYKNGILHAEDDVAIVVEGDKKTVYLLTDADYDIYLEGTDVGEMTVNVETYGKSESDTVYKEYRNVPLSTEATYSMKASNVVKDETYDVLMNGNGETEYIANEVRYQISLENASIRTERGERVNEALLARGESAYLHAEDLLGYEFTEWTVSGDVVIEELTSADTMIHVGTQNSVIKANYVKVAETHTISAKANVGGEISPEGENTLYEGTSETYYFFPEDGYVIYCVLVDGNNIGNVSEYTFENITQDHTIIASFRKTAGEGMQDDILPEDFPKDGIVPDGIWVSGITAYDYTGAAVKQSFRVYDKYTLLKENTDYTISYKNNKNAYTYTEEDYQEYLEGNSAVAVGTFNPKKAPQVVLKMKGNYSGSRTIYFRINPVELDAETIVAEDLTVTYTGKKQTPMPKVTWNGKALKYGTDFYVPEYDATKKDKKAFTEKGTYTLTLTGKKNFTGELPITLTISESVKQIAIDKVTVKGIKDMPYTGEQLKPAGFSVKCKNDVLTEENGDYTVSWGENIAVGTGTITFTGTGLDTDGDGITYIGSKVVKFKITGISMSKTMVTGVEKQYGYTGEAIEPVGNVTYKAGKEGNEIALQKDVHYSVEYQKNQEKGTATIVYSGLAEGGYTGTKKVTFKIVSRNISDMTEDGTTLEQVQVAYVDESNLQDGIYNAPFMKGGAKPDVMVSINDILLTQGKDYTISYSNNKKVASATDKKAPTITIKGKGNYSGTKKVSYAIVPKPLSNENGINVVAKDKAVSTGKNGYRQSFKVYDADGKALGSADYDTKNVTYTLIQTENEDGTIKEENSILDKNSVVAANSVILITVSGKGNYAGGEATGTYRILETGHDISKATIKIKNQEYTGNPVVITNQEQFTEGKVYMKVGKETRVLELGKDIEVVPGSYVKNVNKGTAKVTFRGIGDFGGTKTVSYKIGARSINEIWQGIFSKFSDWFNADVADEEKLSSASVPCHTSVCT